MTPMGILRWCEEHGVRLAVQGDRLHWRAPKGVMSEQVRSDIGSHKYELLALVGMMYPEDLANHVDPTAVAGRAGVRPGTADRARWRDWTAALDGSPRSEWVTGDALRSLPEELQGLVCEREGWSVNSWALYLRRRAHLCRELHPDLAGRYQVAARLLSGDPEDPI